MPQWTMKEIANRMATLEANLAQARARVAFVEADNAAMRLQLKTLSEDLLGVIELTGYQGRQISALRKHTEMELLTGDAN